MNLMFCFVTGFILGFFLFAFVCAVGTMNKLYDAYQDGYHDGNKLKAEEKEAIINIIKEVKRICSISSISEKDFDTICILLSNIIERI